VVISYRRFGTAYRSRLQGSRMQTDRLSRNAVNKVPPFAA